MGVVPGCRLNASGSTPDCRQHNAPAPRPERAGGLTVDQRDDLADFRRRRRTAGRRPAQGVKRMGFRVGDCGTYQLFFAAGEYFGVEGREQDQQTSSDATAVQMPELRPDSRVG